MANVLSTPKRVAIISALCEGASVRSTSRMVDVSKDTVLKLMVDLGEACIAHMDATFRELPCQRLQVDEIWGFCYAKQKNVPAAKQGQFGCGDDWWQRSESEPGQRSESEPPQPGVELQV